MPGIRNQYLTGWGATLPAANPADSGPVTLGLRLQCARAATIVGCRYYRDNSDSGSHVGMLLDPATLQVLRVTRFHLLVAGPAGGYGWEAAYFKPSLHVAAHATIVVAVYFPNGNYWRTLNALNNDVVNGDVTTLAWAFGAENGMYNYGFGLIPRSSFNKSRYGVDALFYETQ